MGEKYIGASLLSNIDDFLAIRYLSAFWSSIIFEELVNSFTWLKQKL